MNAFYVAVSLITFYAVFLNFYKNQKKFIYPVIFLQLLRHAIESFGLEQFQLVGGDLEALIKIVFNVII